MIPAPTTSELAQRLRSLQRHLDEEGWHVHSNTISIALRFEEAWAEKVGDLVRDAFYDGCEAAQASTAPRTRMNQDDLFAAWMESEARKQLLTSFPTLPNTQGKA